MGKRIIVFIIIICFLSAGLFIFLNTRKVSQDIPDDYICIFHGDHGEKTYETYIYKQKNDDTNTGYEYINVTIISTTVEGEVQTLREVTKRGKITWSSEVYDVARENNAYTYVTLPNDSTNYSVADYESRFLPSLK